MPADDLVLNIRQIAQYPEGVPSSSASLLMQLGIGGPYQSISPQALVGDALATGGDMAIAGGLSVQSISSGSLQASNAAINILSAQKACIVDFAATFGSIGGVQIATMTDLAAQFAASVNSFNGRVGAVRLWIDDIICAGGAPIYSPCFLGLPRAETPPSWSNSGRLATTAFVASALASLTLDFAPLDSPAFTGVPTAPTAASGASDGQLATTAFVQNAVTASTAGVSSFNTRTGAVVLNAADVTAAGGAVLASPSFTGSPTAPTPPPGDNSTRLATTAYVLGGAGFAPIASPTFTGIPNAPTPTPGTNTTQLATTAFVMAALGAVNVGVASFNGRQGAVNLIANDISAAGGALLASPVFTGTPAAPTPPPGDNSTRLATTAFVATLTGFAPLASPAFTGTPTAPTAAPATNTTQLATTAFVQAAISAGTAGVVSFNSRTGAVTLQANDISAASGALLASPAFTGTPSAPTAALGVNTTQLATCAFVMNAASTTTPLMDGTAAVGTGTTWARSNHVHPTDTSRAAQSSLASYVPLAGATMSGPLQFPSSAGSVVFGGPPGGGSLWGVTWMDPSFTSNYAFISANSSTNVFSIVNVAGGSNELLLSGDGTFSYVGQGTAYKSGGGSWTAPSDDRIKTVHGDYVAGLDQVLALRPVWFTYKGNDTPTSDLAAPTSGPATARYTGQAPFPGSPHYVPARDRTEFVGFVAQEVETVLPDMVRRSTGFVDGAAVSDLRSVDVSNLVYALVNAVKTLAARVAALEAA
jgi:hypothetical protein